jgi:hypothetical protein
VALEFDENDTTHYRNTSFPGSGASYTLTCWAFFRSYGTTQNACMFLGGNGGLGVPLTDQRILQVQTTGEVRAQIVTVAGGTDYAFDNTNLTLSNWHFLCAQFITATSRYVWVDTNKSAENTASNSPGVPERVVIGSADDDTPNRWVGGILAECAVWAKNIGDDAITSLALGYSPLLVDPGNLVSYYPLIRDTRAPYGVPLTQVGATPPTATNHPRVFGMPALKSWRASGLPPDQGDRAGEIDRTGEHRRSKWGLRWNPGALPYNPGG